MQKIKLLLKLFAFIIVIKASFLVSFAFLGGDLGLDLYKKIDSGINTLQNKQYSYELKGGIEGGTITEKINRILKSDGLGKCEISKEISEEDVEKINNGNIELLSEKLEGKCLTSTEITAVQQSFKNLKAESIKRAREKTNQIQRLSKIGLYSDGNIKNSPFDIIDDIKQIDQIVFTQKVEYRGERNIGDNDFGNYLKGKLNNYENDFNKKASEELAALNDATDKIINGDKPPDLNNQNSTNNNLPPDLVNQNSTTNAFGDNTQYSCDNNNESGLSQSDISNILQNSSTSNNNSNNSVDFNGIINKNYKPYNPGTFGFSTQNHGYGDSVNSNGAYSGVNDNDFWGCDTFFCITVEFVTHNSGMLGSSETTMSLQALLERSNNHLKKFANSSLIQAKMSTNNFELGLRDLDLSEIFSFGMVVTKKTPPILDLQGFNDEAGEKKEAEDKKNGVDNNPLSVHNLLKARFEGLGINIKRENDISIYLDRIGDEKSTANSKELDIKNANRNYVARKKFHDSLSGIGEHLANIINSQSNSSDTDQLYKEFLELERFTGEIQAYVNDLYKISGILVKIPIHP